MENERDLLNLLIVVGFIKECETKVYRSGLNQ